MTRTRKLLCCGVAVLVAGVLIWLLRGADPEFAAGSGTAPSGGAVAAPAGGDVSAADDELRVAAQAPAPRAAEPELAHPFEYRLRCSVVDFEGLPVSGAVLAFAPLACALNGWQQTTSRDGAVEVCWRGKVPEMEVALGVRWNGRAQALHRLTAAAGAVQEHVLLVDFGSSGSPCSMAGGMQRAGELRCDACHQRAVFPDLFDVPVQPWGQLHESRLCDVLGGEAPDRGERELGEIPGPPGSSGPPDVVYETIEDAVGPPGEPSRPGAVAGVVDGVDGLPAPGQVVVWRGGGGGWRGRTRTDGEGRFVLRDIPAGTVEVRAGGRSAGRGRVTVEVFPAREAVCRVPLARGHVLRGTAVGPGGEPLEGWRVEFRAQDQRYLDAELVRRDGTFEFANLPGEPGSLLLWSAVGPRLPIARANMVVRGTTDVAFDLRGGAAPSGALRLRPVSPAGMREQQAFAFVWQLDTGRGAAMVHDRDGVLVLGGLRAGTYHVVVGSPACGWVDLGQQWLDGQNSRDLGPVSLPQPGTLQLVQRPAVDFELFLRRADLDVRAPFLPDGDRLRLPPGEWLALWREAGERRARAFTVASGLPVVVDCRGAR